MNRAMTPNYRALSRWTVMGLVLAGLAASPPTAETPPLVPEEPTPPSSPREFFNAGTKYLREGKLREAEAFLESALASQISRFQPPALYNLGHVRFNRGIEELKKGPAAKPTVGRGREVVHGTEDAIHEADEALASNDVQKMVAAYLHGRGQRKELKAATEAVRKALRTHSAALGKWERSSGDFKSTVELKPADTDAQHNADVVDRCIAKLVDSLRELQEMANAMGDKKTELGEKLKQLKGRIPEPDMPPGAAGDDDEDEDNPQGPQPGQAEGSTREGQETFLTPEQAGWLLEAFKLDAERRLPMGQNGPAEPHDRNRPDW